jgi:predicted Rdx family selenoprotein
MKKLISLSIFIFVAFCATSQVWEWVKTINKGATERGRSIGTDKYGNIYITGISRYTTGGSPSNSWHYEWFYKFDISGQLLWEKKIDAFFCKSVTDKNGNTYLISGNKINKYDTNGDIVWSKLITHPYSFFSNITLNTLGGVVVTGGVRTDSLVSLIISYNEEGNINWERIGDFPGTSSDPFEIVIDLEGNLFFLISYSSSKSILAKFNKAGDKEWEKALPATFPGRLTLDNSGNFYFFGSYHSSNPLIVNGITYSSDSPYGGRYVIKLNPDLEPVWVKDFQEQSVNVSTMLTDSANNLYLLGTFTNSFKLDNAKLTSANSEVLVIKLNENGKLIWIRNSTGGAPGTGAILEAMAIDTEGNILISGSINGNFSFDSQTVNSPDIYGDMLIAKISNEILPVEPTSSKINDEQGILLNIYPNPTHNTFSIHYQSAQANKIDVKVLNLTGAIIHQFTEQNLSGTFQREINLGISAPGIYFVELQTEKERLVKRVVVSR